MIKYGILIAWLLGATLASAQQRNKIVTLGTFHFHLVKAQLGVDFDIGSEDKQLELDGLVQQIADYGPTRIFVEWEYAQQLELDSLYALYLRDPSCELIKQRYGRNETKYFDSEVQQLGFRLARKLGHAKLYAMDYMLEEPNDTVMAAISKADQPGLMNEIQQDFGDYGQLLVTKLQQEASIRNLLLFFNSKEFEERLNRGYISLFNKAGSKDDFSGAYFVSERFRRNLYMYSLVQKQVAATDERILVIVGGQHAAAFRDFIRDDKNMEEITPAALLK